MTGVEWTQRRLTWVAPTRDVVLWEVQVGMDRRRENVNAAQVPAGDVRKWACRGEGPHADLVFVYFGEPAPDGGALLRGGLWLNASLVYSWVDWQVVSGNALRALKPGEGPVPFGPFLKLRKMAASGGEA